MVFEGVIEGSSYLSAEEPFKTPSNQKTVPGRVRVNFAQGVAKHYDFRRHSVFSTKGCFGHISLQQTLRSFVVSSVALAEGTQEAGSPHRASCPNYSPLLHFFLICGT